MTLFAAIPCLRASQLRPPPSVYPTTPTSGLDPASVASPLLGRRLHDLEPQDAGLDASGQVVRVDLHCAHAGRLQQDGVLERPERCGVVAGALRGDAKPALAGEVDRRDHVVGGLGVDDRGGPLVDGEVPRLAGLVPALVARRDDLAVEPSL